MLLIFGKILWLLNSSKTALDRLPRDWNDGAEMLSRRGLLDAETRSTIRALHAFGELIGNSDMHAGNLAFFLDDAMPLRVTPSYDMLPMLWAPGSQGEMINRPFAPVPPLPGYRDEWQQAAEWANIFWQRVLDDSHVSEDFHRLAEQARAVVQRLHSRVWLSCKFASLGWFSWVFPWVSYALVSGEARQDFAF